MKLSGGKVSEFLRRRDLGAVSVLLYGPDQGLVRERATLLAQKCVENLADPFSVSELSGVALKQDPRLLSDAAFSMSLGGGDCVVIVREGGDVLTEPLGHILEQDAKPWPIVVEAGELAPRSSLRKLYEQDPRLVALACYPEEGRALATFIKDFLLNEGLSAEPAAVAFLSAVLAGDRQVIRRELEKLALYCTAKDNGADRVTEADALQCVGDSSETSLDNLVFSVGDGDQKAIDKTLAKAFSEGVNPVAAIRAVQRHFQRLHYVRGQVQAGGSFDQALNRLRPPVFFKRKNDFQRQARNWSSENLARALALASENEIACKTTGMPAQILCGRTLMMIAQAARRR